MDGYRQFSFKIYDRPIYKLKFNFGYIYRYWIKLIFYMNILIYRPYKMNNSNFSKKNSGGTHKRWWRHLTSMNIQLVSRITLHLNHLPKKQKLYTLITYRVDVVNVGIMYSGNYRSMELIKVVDHVNLLYLIWSFLFFEKTLNKTLTPHYKLFL